MSKRYTKDEFVDLANNIHNFKYDYSCSDFVFMKSKVTIICPEHGTFEQRPLDHVRGQGCPKCRYIKMSRTRKSRFDLNSFIDKARKVHGDKYDYSKVNYTSSLDKVTIICPEHGEFQQLISNHIRGAGCYKCGKESLANKLSLSLNDFISKANNIHGNFYDYSMVSFNRVKDTITIICPIHGEFKQTVFTHLDGSGCPHCKTSKGELAIKSYLDFKHINYIQQFWFDDCRDKRPLKYDFYLPDLNVCIEFDGIQHFKPIKAFSGQIGLENIKRRDNIKNKYCEDNNIKLIRIPYTSLNKVDNILERELV